MINQSIEEIHNTRSISEAKDIFHSYLKQNNLKITDERNQVLEWVFQTHDHFHVEDIQMSFRKHKINVSRATIYRTLELLYSCKLINKISFDENHYRYEHIYGHEHHAHLICRMCSQIIEFYSPEVNQVKNQIAQKYAFVDTEYSLRIFGLCQKCQPQN